MEVTGNWYHQDQPISCNHLLYTCHDDDNHDGYGNTHLCVDTYVVEGLDGLNPLDYLKPSHEAFNRMKISLCSTYFMSSIATSNRWSSLNGATCTPLYSMCRVPIRSVQSFWEGIPYSSSVIFLMYCIYVPVQLVMMFIFNRKHYKQKLLKRCFQQWEDVWWNGKNEWKLNIRADYHNRCLTVCLQYILSKTLRLCAHGNVFVVFSIVR